MAKKGCFASDDYDDDVSEIVVLNYIKFFSRTGMTGSSVEAF
jgi:hypothetical protein